MLESLIHAPGREPYLESRKGYRKDPEEKNATHLTKGKEAMFWIKDGDRRMLSSEGE